MRYHLTGPNRPVRRFPYPLWTKHQIREMPRRSSRSVSGCMTCRRRKVKCSSRSTPCDACCRLGLSCVSSFQQNFRVWALTEKQDLHELLGSQTASSPVLPDANQTTDDCTLQNQVESSPQPSAICDSTTTRRNGVNSIDSWVDWDSLLSLTGPNRSPSVSEYDFQTLLNVPLDHTWDIASWNQYMNRVPEWLSTKRSMWSCYHYLINLAQAIPDSPLFHGILSWTYAYLFRLGIHSEPSRLTHYMTASNSVRLLSNEVCDNSTALTWPTVNPSEKISQYISTTFFLCQHDLIVGDYESFKSRLNETKRIFSRHWKANNIPGPIESRIVIWLAFMELRFLILSGEENTGGGEEKDLMTTLMDLKAVPVLRGGRKKQSYLSECFGNGLPKEENEEDLRKERCRDKFDTLSFYLSRVRTFEKWDLETESQRDDEPLLVELREAKIEALRADLARIQAVRPTPCLLITILLNTDLNCRNANWPSPAKV